MSQITIATNDQTTAFVVASPTPFAPPEAWYPQVQLISAIVPPKVIPFSRLTPRSFMYIPSHADSKYALKLKSVVSAVATAPARTPTTEAIITITGIISIPDKTLGTKRYSTGPLAIS